jgi:hypothetical protein
VQPLPEEFTTQVVPTQDNKSSAIANSIEVRYEVWGSGFGVDGLSLAPRTSHLAPDQTGNCYIHESQNQGSELNAVLKGEGLFLVEMSILTGLGCILLLYLGLSKKLLTLKNFHQPSLQNQPIACKNCRFYSPNFYVQCAVHPSKVMKPEAANCSDYCHK